MYAGGFEECSGVSCLLITGLSTSVLTPISNLGMSSQYTIVHFKRLGSRHIHNEIEIS